MSRQVSAQCQMLYRYYIALDNLLLAALAVETGSNPKMKVDRSTAGSEIIGEI